MRKDVNHPSVILYSIGNEVPDGSTPVGLHLGARAGREGARARRHSLRHAGGDGSARRRARICSTRSATPRPRRGTRRGHRHQHRNHEPGGLSWARDAVARRRRTRPVRRSRTSTCAGTTTWRPRFDARPRAASRTGSSSRPSPTRRRSTPTGPACSTTPTSSATSPGPGGTTSARRGSAASSTGSSRTRSACRRSAATTRGAPPGAPTSTSPVTAYRSRTTARSCSACRTDPYLAVQRPEHHGKTVVHSSPWSWSDVVSSWSWAGHEGAPVVVEVYADADEVELLLNGRSLGRQPAGRATGTAPSSRRPTNRVELAAVGLARRRGDRPHGAALGDGSGAARRRAPTGREIRADPSDLAFVELTLVDEAGSLYNTADRRVAVERRRPGRAPGPRQREPRAPRRRSPTSRARRSTAARSRSCAPPARARSRVAVDGRRMRTAVACASRRADRPAGDDLGTALAPVPGGVGAVHRAPGRAAVDRRGGGARRGAEVPADNALAPLGRRIDTDESRLPRRVRVHQRPAGVLARRARAVGGRRPVPDAARGRDRRGRLLPPRPDPVDGRPRRRRGDRGRHHVARAHARRCRRATTSPTCSSSRTAARPSARRTPIRTARSTPGALVYATIGARGGGRGRPPSADRARRCSPRSSERELAGPRVVERGRALLRVRSVVRARTRTRCTCCPAGR